MCAKFADNKTLQRKKSKIYYRTFSIIGFIVIFLSPKTIHPMNVTVKVNVRRQVMVAGRSFCATQQTDDGL